MKRRRFSAMNRYSGAGRRGVDEDLKNLGVVVVSMNMHVLRWFTGFMVAVGASSVASQEASLLSCLLEPSSETKLSSPVSGVVAKVNAERGGKVRKGQEVLALESELERASLKSAKARAEFAARKLDRNRRLLEQGLLSDFERDELMTEHQLALLAVNEAEAKLKQRSLKSPIDGVVVKRHVSVGEYVGADPVMELVALNPLHAEVIMRASRYGEISEGMQVTVLVNDPAAAGSVEPHPGVVTVVDRVIDAASSTFGFRVRVGNPELALPAGLKCNIQFAADGQLSAPEFSAR